MRGAKADAFWGFLGLFLEVQGAERVRRVTLQLGNGEVPEEQRQAGAVGELANCLGSVDYIRWNHFGGEEGGKCLFQDVVETSFYVEEEDGDF